MSTRGGPGALGTGVSAALLALAFWGGVARAAEMSCRPVWPAELEVALSSAPADPMPNELVELDVQINNTSGGLADIPLFQLVGAEPLFVIEAQESSYPLVEFARYRLRAVRPGQAALQLSVNFATTYGCVEWPVFVFRSARSLPYRITVQGTPATPTATPTATATPRHWSDATATATRRLTPARTWAASPRR